MRTKGTTNKLGQIGSYWLTKKSGRSEAEDSWCRTWYDKQARQTRRVSLGTADFHEASMILANWAVINERPQNAEPSETLIEGILLKYWEERGKLAANSNTIKRGLALWQQYFAGKTVSDVTPAEQRRFHKWLDNGNRKSNSIDKILSMGRAALKLALRDGEIISAPQIAMTETADEKRSRPPMGRPITPTEIANFLDCIHQRHLFVFVLLAANTLARPEALFDLQRSQFDSSANRLTLNRAGRKQTKKFRPILPVTSTLRPWLEFESDDIAHYVSHHDLRVSSIRTAWNAARSAAGLSDELTPYSIRHGMARELRRRRVPLDEIGLFLGHLPRGNLATTSIYAPMEPEYCTVAIAAIEDVMAEVQAHLKSPLRLDDPVGVASHLLEKRPREAKLSDVERRELLAMIRAGLSTREIAGHFGVSDNTIYWHRKRIRSVV